MKLLEAMPPNSTDVDPAKLVPVIVTELPAAPLVGEKDVIVGDPTGWGTVSICRLTSSMSPLYQSSPAVLEPSVTESSLAILPIVTFRE